MLLKRSSDNARYIFELSPSHHTDAPRTYKFNFIAILSFQNCQVAQYLYDSRPGVAGQKGGSACRNYDVVLSLGCYGGMSRRGPTRRKVPT